MQVSHARSLIGRWNRPVSSLSNQNSASWTLGSSVDALASQADDDYDDIDSKIQRRRYDLACKGEQLLMKRQRDIENWLTEIEIKLIQLQPYASELEDPQQINQIQVIILILKF